MSERSEQGPPSDGERDVPPEGVDTPPARPQDDPRVGEPVGQGGPPVGQDIPPVTPPGGPQDGAPAGPAPAYPPAPPGALPGQPPAYAQQGAPAIPDGSTAPRDKVSVAAFVLSLPGALVIAVPLAIWGLVRTSARARRGRGLAIAALCVSGAWVVVSVLLLMAPGLLGANQVSALPEDVPSVAPPAPGTPAPTASASDEPVAAQPTGPMAKPKRVYWQDLKPMTCVREPDDETASFVTAVDCRAEHDVEVMSRTSLKKTKKWPGDEAVNTAAFEKCSAAFAGYVGVPFDESRLEASFYSTDKEGWDQGDTTLICLIYDPVATNAPRRLKGAAE